MNYAAVIEIALRALANKDELHKILGLSRG